MSISKTLMGEFSAPGGISLVWGSGTPRAGVVSGTCPHVSITSSLLSALHHAALNGNTEITLLLCPRLLWTSRTIKARPGQDMQERKWIKTTVLLELVI